MKTNETKHTPGLFVMESGETVQHLLVGIANGLGDCDHSADLAEAVNLLDKYEGNNAAPAMFKALEAITDQADAQFRCGDSHATFNKQTIASVRAAIAQAQGGGE